MKSTEAIELSKSNVTLFLSYAIYSNQTVISFVMLGTLRSGQREENKEEGLEIRDPDETYTKLVLTFDVRYIFRWSQRNLTFDHLLY